MSVVSPWSVLSWYALGAVLALPGLILLLWALLADRSRGRRRCPGRPLRPCWYDMSATPGLTCPECGRAARSERDLFRTRRRWKPAFFAAALTLLGVGLTLKPWWETGAWHRYVPLPALLLAVPLVNDPWPFEELTSRLDENEHNLRILHTSRLSGAQWDRLVQTCAAIVSDRAADPKRRQQALLLILQLSPDPAPATDAIITALNDPSLQQLAAWGIKACRYKLGSRRSDLLAALLAISAPEPGRLEDLLPTRQQDLATVTRVFAQSDPVSDTERHAPPPDPDEFIARAQGADSRTLMTLFDRLGVQSRMLVWPWDGESGPFTIDRFDLPEDSLHGMACALLVRPSSGGHFEWLFWRREPGTGAWRFASGITCANWPAGKVPQLRTQSAPDGRAWIVMDSSAGLGPGFFLRMEHWVRFDGDEPRIDLSLLRSGFRNVPRNAELGWTLERDQPSITLVRGRIQIEYNATLNCAPLWSSLWTPPPPGVIPERLPPLGAVRSSVRFVQEPSGRFVLAQPPCWASDLLTLQRLPGALADLSPAEQALLLDARSDTALDPWLSMVAAQSSDPELKKRIETRLQHRPTP